MVGEKEAGQFLPKESLNNGIYYYYDYITESNGNDISTCLQHAH